MNFPVIPFPLRDCAVSSYHVTPAINRRIVAILRAAVVLLPRQEIRAAASRVAVNDACLGLSRSPTHDTTYRADTPAHTEDLPAVRQFVRSTRGQTILSREF